jgi:hypothetical protein
VVVVWVLEAQSRVVKVQSRALEEMVLAVGLGLMVLVLVIQMVLIPEYK